MTCPIREPRVEEGPVNSRISYRLRSISGSWYVSGLAGYNVNFEDVMCVIFYVCAFLFAAVYGML